MDIIVTGFDLALGVLKPVLFYGAVVLAGICGVDWAVRTRRISPFGGVARFFRGSVQPLMAPVERRLVRSGGVPSHAPWYALGVVVVGGIVLITLLGFLRDQLAMAANALLAGPSGIVVVLVAWGFGILRIALLMTVIASWVRANPYSKWWRWAWVMTDPILRPLRRIIPPLGMIDVTPIAAYFLLGIIEGFLLRALA